MRTMTTLTNLETARQTETNLVKESIKAEYPVITDVNIYNPRNIFIQSAHFSADIYSHSIDINDLIRMNCSTSHTAIPTEEEAVQAVRDMTAERDLFILVVQDIMSALKVDTDGL